MVFSDPSGGPPFAVFDWEDVRLSSGMLDVASFLGGCLAPSDRQAHERALLASYHRALIEAGVTGYPFTACWREYRLAMLDRVIQGVLMAVSLSGGSAHDRRLAKVVAERFGVASIGLALPELCGV